MSTCPVCSASGVPFKQVIGFGGDYAIHSCSSCHLEYVDPMPSEQVLIDFYASYHDVRAGDAVLLLNAQRNVQCLQSLGLTERSQLLDYGSGKDVFVTLGKGTWQSYDPHTHNNDASVLVNSHYDFITSWGVLEHVVSPIAMIQQLAPLLKANGLLVMTTVDIDSAIPYRFKPPEHLTYWTKEAAKALLEACGCVLLSYEPYIMMQAKQVYMDIILRTLPVELKTCVHYESMPDYVTVPTNEIFIVAKKLP